MPDLQFVENPTLVKELHQKLHSTGEFTGYERELFSDADGNLWERYTFDLDDNDAFGFRKYPYPELSEILDVVFNSKSEDEVSGACGLLYELELSQRIKYRKKLIDYFTKHNEKSNAIRFEICFNRTNLGAAFNYQDVISKSHQQIISEYNQYKQLAKDAQKLAKHFKIDRW